MKHQPRKNEQLSIMGEGVKMASNKLRSAFNLLDTKRWHKQSH